MDEVSAPPTKLTTSPEVVVADGLIVLEVAALPAFTPHAARATGVELIRAANQAELR